MNLTRAKGLRNSILELTDNLNDIIRTAVKEGLTVKIEQYETQIMSTESPTPIITVKCSISPDNID